MNFLIYLVEGVESLSSNTEGVVVFNTLEQTQTPLGDVVRH